MRFGSVFGHVKVETFQCCFCSEQVSLNEASTGVLTLRIPASGKKTTQDLYCHRDCLTQRVDPQIVTLFEAFDR